MNEHRSLRPGWQPVAGAAAPSHEEEPQRHEADVAQPSGVREIVEVLRAKARPVLLWTLACLAAAALYLHNEVPEYVATTQIVLEASRPPVGVSDQPGGGYTGTLDAAQADSEIQVVKSERTLRFVFETLHLVDDPLLAPPPPGLIGRLVGLLPMGGTQDTQNPVEREASDRARAFQAFSDRISVRRIGQSYVLEISFRGPDPSQSARLANAVTAAYIRDNIIYGAAAAQRGAEILQGRIADIKAEQDLAVEAVRKGALPDVPFPDSDVRVVSAALKPLGKTYPQSKLILLLAASFGLLSGAGVAVARHKLDRTVRSRHQVARVLEVDSLIAVPRFQRSPSGGLGRHELTFTAVIEADASPFADALRVLRTTILSTKKASRYVVIGVVSWSPGEGRSSIASNLAFLIAASRERVVLVDADFRNPALSRSLAPNAAIGLDTALLSHIASVERLTLALNPNLEVVPAIAKGRTSNSNVFIGSAEMARLLRTLHAERNIVVDLPPMSLSSDTQAIAPLLDGVVLVVEANRTSVDDLNEAFRTLRNAEVPVLRVVLNKVPPAARPRSFRWGLPI